MPAACIISQRLLVVRVLPCRKLRLSKTWPWTVIFEQSLPLFGRLGHYRHRWKRITCLNVNSWACWLLLWWQLALDHEAVGEVVFLDHSIHFFLRGLLPASSTLIPLRMVCDDVYVALFTLGFDLTILTSTLVLSSLATVLLVVMFLANDGFFPLERAVKTLTVVKCCGYVVRGWGFLLFFLGVNNLIIEVQLAFNLRGVFRNRTSRMIRKCSQRHETSCLLLRCISVLNTQWVVVLWRRRLRIEINFIILTFFIYC